jgi:hypothetical protein
LEKERETTKADGTRQDLPVEMCKLISQAIKQHMWRL